MALGVSREQDPGHDRRFKGISTVEEALRRWALSARLTAGLQVVASVIFGRQERIGGAAGCWGVDLSSCPAGGWTAIRY